MFATYDRSGTATPCALQRGNFDLALHSLTASIDPRDYYFKYHSSQFEPDGQNDARINNVGIDVALETVGSSVHPAVIRDAMIEFQEIYVEQVVEIPMYVSETVELRAPKIGNVVGGSPLGGATWNVADWFVKG
jgi:ABC-type transport system substrate-binding protein